MKIIGGLTLFFYALVFFALGCLFIAVSLGFLPQEMVADSIAALYADPNAKIILGITGIILICVNIMVIQLIMGRIRREKTIAFENPNGQVTISLSAIEDFIKRALRQLPEVKELRPSVKAGKKGISIISKVTLFSDVNIPETAEKIQNIVKSRVQDMLGVEEPVNIRVRVVKIAHKEEAPKNQNKDDRSNQFRGSIEYGNY